MTSHNTKESQKKEQDASSKNWHRADILAAIKKKGSVNSDNKCNAHGA